MINYIADNDLKYYDQLLNGLESHNKKFVRNELAENLYIYILEDGELLGSCHTDLVWNWVFIEELTFQNSEMLNILLEVVFKRYSNTVAGVFCETLDPVYIELLKRNNFDVLYKFKDKPCGKISYILNNDTMTFDKINHNYDVVISLEPNEKYQKKVYEKISVINKLNGVDDSEIEIAFMAFDDEFWIGGVYGYIKYDYLHVNLLWVKEDYRGNGIATNLMNLLEDEAVHRGCNNFSVETCTFHSEEFYEKRDYIVRCILKEMPKGYCDYFMTKSVKKVAADR